MLISAARSATVVRGSVSLLACLLVSFAARADDMQDASRMLKAGQHQQALERVNKVLAAKPRDPQARFLRATPRTRSTSLPSSRRIIQSFPSRITISP